MKIAILGAHGFLGTHLTKYYINKGDSVIKLGRNYDITKTKDCDFLIHCAFIGGKKSNTSKEIYKENIQIGKRIRDLILLDDGQIVLLTDRGKELNEYPEIIIIGKK